MNQEQTDHIKRLHIEELRNLSEQLARAQAQLDRAVTDARAPDRSNVAFLSWREIGDALGVSKQAAQQHWGDPAAA